MDFQSVDSEDLSRLEATSICLQFIFPVFKPIFLVQDAITKYNKLDDLKNKHLLLRVMDARRSFKTKVPEDSVFVKSYLLTVSSLSCLILQGHESQHEDSTLMTRLPFKSSIFKYHYIQDYSYNTGV